MTAAVGILHLYEVVEQLVRIGDELAEGGGEITPEIEGKLRDLEGTFEEKVERILLYAQNLKASSEAAAKESDRLAILARGRASIAGRLKDYVKAQMEQLGRPKIETARIVARIQKNSRPVVSYTGELAELPPGFIRTVIAFNAEAAYEVFKAGGPLPAGVSVVQGTHLRVQ